MTMALRITSFNTIDSLVSVDNVPLSEIETRFHTGRPTQFEYLDKEETFKSVLKQDWQTVASLNTTHIGIANKIQKIFELAIRSSGEEILIYDPMSHEFRIVDFFWMYTGSLLVLISNVIFAAATVFFSFYVAPLMLITIPVIIYVVSLWKNNQFLKITNIQSLFFFKPEDKAVRVTNLKTNESVEIYDFPIEYIRNYGFYGGGGENNPFRIDPARFVAVISGNLK